MSVERPTPAGFFTVDIAIAGASAGAGPGPRAAGRYFSSPLAQDAAASVDARPAAVVVDDTPPALLEGYALSAASGGVS